MIKYVCLKCKKVFSEATAALTFRGDGQRKLICPSCGSQKYKFQNRQDGIEKNRAAAREHARKRLVTPEGRAANAARSARYREDHREEINQCKRELRKSLRPDQQRVIWKKGYTALEIQQMTIPQIRRNWKEITSR